MRNEVIIFYPKTLGVVKPEDLQLCERLISDILKSKKEKLVLSVNSKLGVIESNDTQIKITLTLLSKTRKLASMYDLFQRMLSKSNELKCKQDGELVKLVVIEKQQLPDLKLEIEKLVVKIE